MKTLLREEIYAALKNKIESGYYPVGSRLPSKSKLCALYGVSDSTVRHALDRLEKDRLIRVTQGRAPVVTRLLTDGNYPLAEIDRETLRDIFLTEKIFCAPLVARGAALCGDEDWQRLERIIGEDDSGAWKPYRYFWRYFIDKIGNALIGKTVRLLGLNQVYPLPDDNQKRLMKSILEKSLEHLKEGTYEARLKNGVKQEREFLSNLQYSAAPQAISADWPRGIGKKLRPDVCLSSVYLDILGKISVGYYRKGNKLPSHKELCALYGVSHNTTVEAVAFLRGRGAVTSVRSKGVFVAVGGEEADKIVAALDGKITERYFREYLDTLEILSLTVKSVALCAAQNASAENARALAERMVSHWQEKPDYLRTPIFLLDFIVAQIEIRGLREIYEAYRFNFLYACSVPGLVSHARQTHNQTVYEQSVDAAEALVRNDRELFAERCETMFRNIEKLVREECGDLGYLQK